MQPFVLGSCGGVFLHACALWEITHTHTQCSCRPPWLPAVKQKKSFQNEPQEPTERWLNSPCKEFKSNKKWNENTGGVQHKDLIVAAQRNAYKCVCVCVSVGRGHEECELLHGDKRWPMTGREAARKRHREGNRGRNRQKAGAALISMLIR